MQYNSSLLLLLMPFFFHFRRIFVVVIYDFDPILIVSPTIVQVRLLFPFIRSCCFFFFLVLMFCLLFHPFSGHTSEHECSRNIWQSYSNALNSRHAQHNKVTLPADAIFIISQNTIFVCLVQMNSSCLSVIINLQQR